jgi:hypothetical protein
MGAFFRAPRQSGSVVYQTPFRKRLAPRRPLLHEKQTRKNVSIAAFFIPLE